MTIDLGPTRRRVHPDRSWRPLMVAGAFAAAVFATVAVLVVGPWLDPREKQVLIDSSFVLAPLPGVAYCLRAVALTGGRLRVTWLCFAATLAAWSIGNVFWFYYQILAAEQPFPTWADLMYVLALLFAAVGLALFPVGRRTGEARPRLLLDALSVGCAVLLLSALLVLDEVVPAMGTGLAAVVFITYPVGDVLLASMAILLLSRSPDRGRVELWLVSVGLLVYAVSDTTYALLSARGQFQIGTPLDLGWLAGYLLVGLAALPPTAVASDPRLLRPAGTNTAGTLLVYGTMAGAAAVAFTSSVDHPLEYSLGAVLLLLLGARQVVLTRDNRLLQEGLERTVAARTSQLSRLARRHQRILHAVGEGIYEVDDSGRITFVNPAAARLLGRQAKQLLGQEAHAAFHGAHRAVSNGDGTESALGCHVHAALRAAQIVRRADETYLRPDGSRFPVEVTASPIMDEHTVIGAVVVFSDISERRAVERMKDEFVSVVSHELRTPLTAIRGSLGLLAGGAVGQLPVGAERLVGIGLSNSERLTRLINDILDLERIQSGHIPMEFQVLEAADVIAATLTSLRPIAEAAAVRLVSGRTAGRIHGDADRVVQALTNLVGNAIKFSPAGGHVEVSAELDGAHVTFRVADHGRGIPADKLRAVFGRFQQVDSSDARDKGGTGLGLAITKSIVERHGGHIWVESEEGRGSVFSFTVPAALAPGPAGLAVPPEDTDAPTVLLCDDDPDILEVLSTLLREHGYATRPVARGRDAVDYAVSSPPDVILLDLRMPGMTGWEAISALKSHSQTADIPVVVMSALGPEVDPELAAHTEGWLTKPVDEARMARTLLSALQRDGHPPVVLIVEDDDDLASILVEIFRNEGLGTIRAATQPEAVRKVRELRPDVLVLDIYLLEGDGFGVVEELRQDGRLGEVPIIVYSAHELDPASRERLQLKQMEFLTKSHASPQDLARRVVQVVHAMARRGSASNPDHTGYSTRDIGDAKERRPQDAPADSGR